MLIPEVVALLHAGKLCEHDADWIGRLKPSSQLAAAIKCGRPNLRCMIEDRPRSCITHGSGRAGQDAR